MNRREFFKLCGALGAGAVLPRPGDPRLLLGVDDNEPGEMGPLGDGADLDLTYFWDGNVYILWPDRGRVRVSASLFIEKWTTFNYDVDIGPKSPKAIILPRNVTQLEWNSSEAIHELGTLVLRPGDEFALTEEIDPFDALTPNEYGDKGRQGDGYINFLNGICNMATTFGEVLGIVIEVNGVWIPFFIARPTSIQPHNYAHNPAYYDYAYNGLGIGVSPTVDRGHLPLMLNPNLPRSVVLRLHMEARDTQPDKKRAGIYKPTVVAEIEGLPSGTRVGYQRPTANRETIVQRVIGAKDYIMWNARSVYFDKTGAPIVGEPIPSFIPFDSSSAVEVTSMMETIMSSYSGSSGTPNAMFQEAMFPGGVARPGTHIGTDSVYWERSDTLLPIAEGDLPSPMNRMSQKELLRILSWNNIADKRNRRYEKGKGIVAVKDWAQAYRFKGYPIAAPIPRWMTMRKQLITASIFYDWMAVDPGATLLGWRPVTSSEEAQALANAGYFVTVIPRNKRSSGLSPIAVVAPGDGKIDKSGIFWPNAVDGVWRFGPKNGKTVRDCVGYTINNGDYFPPAYFAWFPPDWS